MHNICITWTNITFFFSFLRKVLHLLLEGFIYVKPQIKRFRLHWLYQELRTLAMNIVFYLSILYLQRAAEKKKLVVDIIRHFLLESQKKQNTAATIPYYSKTT